jgi:hypothetical protein
MVLITCSNIIIFKVKYISSGKCSPSGLLGVSMFGLFWRRFVFLTWRQCSRCLANNGNQRAKPYSYPLRFCFASCSLSTGTRANMVRTWYEANTNKRYKSFAIVRCFFAMLPSHLAQVYFGVPIAIGIPNTIIKPKSKLREITCCPFCPAGRQV